MVPDPGPWEWHLLETNSEKLGLNFEFKHALSRIIEGTRSPPQEFVSLVSQFFCVIGSRHPSMRCSLNNRQLEDPGARVGNDR